MVMLFVATFLLDDPARDRAALAAASSPRSAAARAFPNLWRLRWIIVPVFVFTLSIWTLFYPAPAAGAGRRAATRCASASAWRSSSRRFLVIGLLFLATTTVEEFAFALTRLGVPVPRRLRR